MRSLLTVFFCTFLTIATCQADEDLHIDPVIQRTPVWCWAAVSEMVLDHYGIENANPAGIFQCAIVAAAGVASNNPQCFYNCQLCVVSAGSASNLRYWLENYSEVASRFLGYQIGDVRTRYKSRALRWSEVMTEIDNGNPIIVGISPGQRISMRGGSQHVALIVGYEEDGRLVVVNDPYPFPLMQGGDPYQAAGGDMVELGQYRIGFDNFRSGLNWGESIMVEEN